ncbi:hypothetical protein [Aquibacillus rhizosphaerae]|uniref:Uncharacterized protein n=1 Tax=Aquibacillus rhizosphaerae TaxID=3051431 RepID=A0ABT7L0R6_9BACI|nr:hypothetical protein [Aquibacillus sp. LR5S19]MDL4839426.1 hypothetical protein [Aquibacillus sp. LR5S19]
MKQNKAKWVKITGGILFVLAVGFFCLQIGYLLVQPRYQVEYIDNRIFYIINILSLIFLLFGLMFLLTWKKGWKIIVSSLAVIFIIINGVLLYESNQETKNITSISPNFKHVLAIKQNTETGEAMYYRSYYGILSRPNDRLELEIAGNYKIDWLANDIAAFTYQAADNTIQQFIGTYGDRKNGRSYYNVEAEIQGKWQGDNARVETEQLGISITVDGHTELFEWNNIEQFGTLAIVLKKNNEAVWTIGLNENFKIYSDAAKPTVGNITLYKATMEESQPLVLDYEGEQ